MKKTLFSLVCFLFSSVVFANDASTSSDSNFFDFLVKRKTIKAEYRHQFFSVSDENKDVKRFTRTPHFRVDIPVDIFGGVLVGTTKLRIENRDGNGYVKQPEFDLTSPYLNFESETFTAGLSVSYLFPLNGNTDKVDLNTSVAVTSPKINTSVGTLSLKTGIDSTVYFKTYNQEVDAAITPEEYQNLGSNSKFYIAAPQNAGDEITYKTKTQKPDFEINFTLLETGLDLSCVQGLSTFISAEYLTFYKPVFTVEGTSHEIARTSKVSWGISYKLSDSVTIANTLYFGFDGLFADKLPANTSIETSDTVKVSDTIGVKFAL